MERLEWNGKMERCTPSPMAMARQGKMERQIKKLRRTDTLAEVQDTGKKIHWIGWVDLP